MLEIDLNWVKKQLTQAKTKRVVGDSVIHLLDQVKYLPTMSEADLKNSIEIFSKLSLGYSLIQENKNEKWDTGDFLTEKYPEVLHTFSEVTKVRANWEIELKLSKKR